MTVLGGVGGNSFANIVITNHLMETLKTLDGATFEIKQAADSVFHRQSHPE